MARAGAKTRTQYTIPFPARDAASRCIVRKPRGGSTGSKGQLIRITCAIKKYGNRFLARSQAFPAKRSLYAGELCACGQFCAWSETSREVDVWGEWHQNVTPQRSRSPAPARPVYGARALQSVSGTINQGWRARALRRYILVPLPPHVYPTSTSRDVSDQAYHAHNCPHAHNSPAYNERLAGKAWERG